MKTIQQILDEDRAKSKINEVSEARINRTIANKAKAEDPAFQKNRIEKLKKTMETDSYQIIDKENRKRRWNDPEKKKQQSELMTQLNLDPTKKEKRVDAMKKAWSDPELKKKHSEKMKEFWNRPENKSKRQNNSRSKPIMTPDGEFQTLYKAAEHFCIKWNVSIHAGVYKIKKFILNKEPNWFYIKKI